MIAKQYVKTGPYAFANLCKDQVLTAPASSTAPTIKDSIYVGKVEVGNSSGADAKCGFGVELPDAMWKLGHWDDAPTATYTDDTTDAQDAGANDVTVGTDTVNDDGIVIQCLVPFNVVGFDIGTAEAGTAGTYAYEYWNGSAWTTLPTLATPDWTATGDQYLQFLKPVGWTKLATGDTPVTAGCTAGYYALKIDASTAAGTSAPILDSAWVVDLVDYVEAVGDGKSVILNTSGELKLPWRGALVPYCSTANAANWVNVEYRFGG